MNQTKQIIYEMLTESTGTHMLDSGGDDDRHWQQNQKMSLEDFENEIEYEFFDTDTEYPYREKSLFHHLVECCEFAERETMYFENWIDEDKYHYIDNPEGRTNELPSVEEYMTERFGQEAECINYYNGDCDLSQTIQFVCVGEFVRLTTFPLKGDIVVIQSFLASQRAINLFAFACVSASVDAPGPMIRKSTASSSLLL